MSNRKAGFDYYCKSYIQICFDTRALFSNKSSSEYDVYINRPLACDSFSPMHFLKTLSAWWITFEMHSFLHCSWQ